MWTYNCKQIVIAINTKSIQYIQFYDGTEEKGFCAAIKSFKRGIFVNPTLDKRKYLSLLKVFHPDVSKLDADLATQIATAIISAKDDAEIPINYQKTTDRSPPNTEASTSSNYHSWSQYYTWSDWTNFERQKAQRAQTRHNQKPKQPKPKIDFETWLSYVPTNYWNILGDYDTFERDVQTDFRLFKRCYYGYFDTELEIVFRKRCIYREKVTAIHRNCLHIIERLNLNELTKSDLWTLCNYEAIPYNQFERKTDLVNNIFTHLGSFCLEHDTSQHCWSLLLTSPRPLWKRKFVKSNHHDSFDCTRQ